MPKRKKLMDQVRAAVERSGVSRYQIWRDTGIDQAVLSGFLKGTRGMSLDTLDTLADYLHLEVRVRGRRRR